MKVKQDEIGKKVQEIAVFFNDPQTPAYYFPNQCQRILAFVVHNGRIRNDWPRKSSQIVSQLHALASQVDRKKAENYQLNYLTIMRVAHLLDGYSGGELEISGNLDQQYWREDDIPTDALERDYKAVKGGKYAAHTAELYQDGSSQPAAQPAQQPQAAPQAQPAAQPAASPIEQGGGRREIPRSLIYVGAVAIGLLIAVILWQLFGDQLAATLFNGGGETVVTQPGTNPGVDLTQPNNGQPSGLAEALRQAQEAAGVTSIPQVGPEGNTIPGGAPISSPLQGIQQSLLLGLGVLSQVTFWILVVLSIALAYEVFKDARARASEGDFSAFMRLMGVVAILAVIPVKAIIQIDLTIWNWHFPMPTSYNLILLLVAASGLWGIAQDRMTEELDLTPLSAGLFVAGIIFFITNAVAFLSWQIPLETYIAWGVALLIHMVEMVRQEDTKEALLLTGLGIILQLVVFFSLAWALGTTASPFFLDYGQEISFLLSVLLSVGLVSFGLNILSEQNLLPAGGQMLMHIETSSHDAGLLLIMWSVIFMSQYWV